MEVTTREAIRRICELHMIGKVEANRVLIAGLAGPGQKVGSAMLDRWGCLDGRRFPMVATIASWVVFGAEVVGHTYDEGAPPAANRSTPPRYVPGRTPG